MGEVEAADPQAQARQRQAFYRPLKAMIEKGQVPIDEQDRTYDVAVMANANGAHRASEPGSLPAYARYPS